MSDPFVELGDAINDQRFVDVDLALRRGQHIDRDDADAYAYLMDARSVLEPFYQRYACELVHRTDGYFFLLPLSDKVPRRLLGIPEMIVGQAAALLYLDPATIERGGVLTKDDILSHLAAIMGTDALVAAFNPKRKRMDERVAQETVRQRTAEALRKLAQLGFVSPLEDGQIRLRGALMRFADPVRGAGSPREALEKLIARGEIALPADAANGDDDHDEFTQEPEAAPSDSGFTYDSEFPLEPEGVPEGADEDADQAYPGDDNERSDTGDDLGPDDALPDDDQTSAGKTRKPSDATTESAEWDPSFDDFD